MAITGNRGGEDPGSLATALRRGLVGVEAVLVFVVMEPGAVKSIHSIQRVVTVIVIRGRTIFARPEMHGRIGIVAVGSSRQSTPPWHAARRSALPGNRLRVVGICIRITVERQQGTHPAFVDPFGAVLIDAIALLGRTGMDVRIVIIAVRSRIFAALLRSAAEVVTVARRRNGQEAVAILVTVIVGQVADIVFVNLTVTVIVRGIADFRGSRKHVGVGVVAVVPRFQATADTKTQEGITRTGDDLTEESVSVLVTEVLQFRADASFVGVSVTIAVDAVAQFCCTGVDLRVRVQTIAHKQG